ncbi:MAG TPA: glucose 1-dehydrogenase [Ilumatobacteraceae bacterium]|jgi:threonine dehydrogenase-like Zn-dependent dehydrogenase|nr:glucose 1-dehydrogenase [Ilumatobacteraceae bacterium]
MQAVTVVPGTSGSARFDEVSEPGTEAGSVVVEALAVGICGTDAEIANGEYGWAPPGEERLILGHESLGRVVDPGATGLSVGDHVVGIVRRPDSLPCPSCAVGEFDMCSNGMYTERGIKQAHGFMSERWRIEPDYVVRVDKDLGVTGVLMEPTTVVAKAWEQIIKIGQRTFWEPRTVLVVGAGPIGLLAAMIGAQHGLDVHVLDRVTTGPKPALVQALGAEYHSGAIDDIGFHPDIVVECTGVASLVQQAASAASSGGIVCLTGISSSTSRASGPGENLATEGVLKNLVMFGSVNANRRHYYRAAKALAAADRSWLEQLITRRVNPDDVDQIVGKGTDDIKVVMEFQQP